MSIFNGIDQRARKDNKGRSDGKLTQEDLRDFYSAKDHPEVRAGKKTEGQVLSEMMSTFEGKHGNKDGVVTLEEWIGYASKQGSAAAQHTPQPSSTATPYSHPPFPPHNRYYEEISASMDNDDHFNMMLMSAWSMLFDPKTMGDKAIGKPVRRIREQQQRSSTATHATHTLSYPSTPSRYPRVRST